jgi:hypothetical protein
MFPDNAVYNLCKTVLVPANLAGDLVKLPRASKKEILLVKKDDESAKLLSLQEASRLISEAYKDGQPVWIVM